MYPGGLDARAEGCVSVCLELAGRPFGRGDGAGGVGDPAGPPPPAPRARFELALVDAAGGEPLVVATPPGGPPGALRNGRARTRPPPLPPSLAHPFLI